MNDDEPDFVGLGEHVLGLDQVIEEEGHIDLDYPDAAIADLAVDPVQREREWALVKGLLWWSSKIVVDGLFEDVALLREKGPKAWEDTQFVSWLPPQFGPRYDGLFAKRFLVAAVDVTRAIANAWNPPPTVAHELATHLLLEHTEACRETFSIDLQLGHIDYLTDVLFQDRDFDVLYIDGAVPDPFDPDPPLNLDFESWFVPFDPTALPAPYATTLTDQTTPPPARHLRLLEP